MSSILLDLVIQALPWTALSVNGIQVSSTVAIKRPVRTMVFYVRPTLALRVIPGFSHIRDNRVSTHQVNEFEANCVTLSKLTPPCHDGGAE